MPVVGMPTSFSRSLGEDTLLKFAQRIRVCKAYIRQAEMACTQGGKDPPA